MKQFIQKTLLFLLPAIVLLYFFEMFLHFIPNDYKYKKEQLLKYSQEIKILVLGSSHAHYGINPSYFSMNGFNSSNISQSLDIDYKLLEEYGTELNQLEYVIIPISYFSLFSTLEQGSENWRIKNYALYYGLKFSFSFKNYFELLNGTVLSSLSRVYYSIRDKSKLVTVSDKGFGLNYNSTIKNDLKTTGETAALRHTYFDIETFQHNKKVLANIIEWCNTKKVKLFFITLPAFYTYRNRLDNNQLNATVEYIDYIAKRNNNVYYYNFLNDAEFIEEDYFDADHLNEIGAKKLTKKINSILK
jgi:hypothetical protein